MKSSIRAQNMISLTMVSLEQYDSIVLNDIRSIKQINYVIDVINYLNYQSIS